jgi:hypothetical protein
VPHPLKQCHSMTTTALTPQQHIISHATAMAGCRDILLLPLGASMIIFPAACLSLVLTTTGHGIQCSISCLLWQVRLPPPN